MGLFSRRKNKPDKKTKEILDSNKIYLSDGASVDMVSVVKKEQQEEILNPFAKDSKGREFNPNAKSVAKTYGIKYVGSSGRQLASSKVVDVRSYKKPASRLELPKKQVVDDGLIKVDEEKEVQPAKSKSNFFEDLMKELEEEEQQEKKEPVKLELPKKKSGNVNKKPRKKSVDIDIISGDFGGIDIM